MTGSISAGPHYLRVMRVYGQAEDGDPIAGGANLRRNTRVAGLPGQPVISAYVYAGEAIRNVPGVGLCKVVADVVTQAAGRSPRRYPG